MVTHSLTSSASIPREPFSIRAPNHNRYVLACTFVVGLNRLCVLRRDVHFYGGSRKGLLTIFYSDLSAGYGIPEDRR